MNLQHLRVGCLVVINSGASLSVWKDAERKAALCGKRRAGPEKEMKFDWQGVREWVTHPALGCGGMCGCVFAWLTNIWSHQHFRCWLSRCVCACWRKMKVVWWPYHNTEARFKRRYLSSPHPPALKSTLLHHHSANHSSCSGLYQFMTAWKLCLYGLLIIDGSITVQQQ